LYLYGIYKETVYDGKRETYINMLRQLCLPPHDDNDDDDDDDGGRGGTTTTTPTSPLCHRDIVIGSDEEEEEDEAIVVMALRSLIPHGFNVFYMREYDNVGRGANRKQAAPADQGSSPLPITTHDDRPGEGGE